MSLEGKVAFVTGASRPQGIGRAIAVALAEKDVSVVLAARTAKEISEAAKQITRSGKKALSVPTDVTKEKDVKKLVQKTLREFGRIDILVNNAGAGFAKPILKTTVEEWDLAVNTNLKGTYLCSRFAAFEMVKRKSGVIVNIASAAGTKGYLHQGAYCASKHGAVGLSRVLAMELKPYGIKVHTICPGGVDTKLVDSIRPDIPKKDLMRTEDIASLVIFLITQPPNATIEEVVISRFAAQ